MSDRGLPNEELGRVLLRVARRFLHQHYGLETTDEPDRESELDGHVGGVFATLELAQELRGCVGFVLVNQDLRTLLKRAVVAAAIDDPRFPRLERDDVPRLRISITVLASPVPLSDPDEIEIGRDGLIVSREGERGLLLPQVAEKRGWNSEQFLAETCRKAGLAPRSWCEPGTTIQRFEAVHFEEST